MSICSTAISKDAREGMKPLAVPVKIACRLVGVGNTTMWALIKDGRVKTISIRRRRLVIYASLELLTSEAQTGEDSSGDQPRPAPQSLDGPSVTVESVKRQCNAAESGRLAVIRQACAHGLAAHSRSKALRFGHHRRRSPVLTKNPPRIPFAAGPVCSRKVRRLSCLIAVTFPHRNPARMAMAVPFRTLRYSEPVPRSRFGRWHNRLRLPRHSCRPAKGFLSGASGSSLPPARGNLCAQT